MTLVLFFAVYLMIAILTFLVSYWVVAPWSEGFKAFTSPKRAVTDPTRRRR